MEKKERRQRYFLLKIHAILLFDDKHWHFADHCLLKLCESLKENQTFCHGNSAASDPHFIDSIGGKSFRAHVQIAGAADLDSLANMYASVPTRRSECSTR